MTSRRIQWAACVAALVVGCSGPAPAPAPTVTVTVTAAAPSAALGPSPAPLGVLPNGPVESGAYIDTAVSEPAAERETRLTLRSGLGPQRACGTLQLPSGTQPDAAVEAWLACVRDGWLAASPTSVLPPLAVRACPPAPHTCRAPSRATTAASCSTVT